MIIGAQLFTVHSPIIYAGGIPQGVGGSGIVSPIPTNGQGSVESERILQDVDYQAQNTQNKETYVTGTVRNVKDGVLSLQTDEGVREFILPKSGFVLKGALGLSTNLLQPGDEVTLRFDSQGMIQSIEAASPIGIPQSLLRTGAELLAMMIISALIAALITKFFFEQGATSEEKVIYRKPQVIGI